MLSHAHVPVVSTSRLRTLVSRPSVRLLLFFLLLLLRSHTRLFYPQVWGEEGRPSFKGSVIFDFVKYGPSAVFRPVNGYLILLPKTIGGLSLLISFSHYPIISATLAWVSILLILLVVSSDKTQLRGGLALGVLALLVPSDPEVFGLGLYTFWWATLLLFAVLLWKANSKDLKWRLPLMVVAGVSSPVVVGMAPLFAIRSVLYRRTWQEWTTSGVALLCAAVQLGAWKVSAIKFPPRPPVTIAEILHTVPVFFGRYLIGNLLKSTLALWVAGLLCLAFFLFIIARCYKNLNYWSLSALFAVSVAMAMRRVPVTGMHPVSAGPRYFFLPFVLMSWFVIQFTVANNPEWLRIVGFGVLGLSIVNAVPVLSRMQDSLHWRTQVFTCPLFDYYSIPVHYNGHAYGTWQLRLTGVECDKLLNRDLLRNAEPPPLTYPYTVFTTDLSDNRKTLADFGSLAGTNWVHTDPHEPRLVGVASVETANTTNAHTDLVLHLRRGQTVLYRTSVEAQPLRVLIDDGILPFSQWLQPSIEWRYLNFSNSLLPERFEVRFIEQGYSFRLPIRIALAEQPSTGY